VRWRVALVAGNASVLSFKFEASEPVVELLLRWLPANQIEVFSIVLQMAAHTLLAIGIAHLHLRVVTVLVLECLGNLGVAVETLESGSAGAEFVAGITLRGPAEGRVSFGQGPGRDLCPG